jgi:hypothetical protein
VIESVEGASADDESIKKLIAEMSGKVSAPPRTRGRFESARAV